MSETIIGRTMDERVAHIEGTLEQMNQHLGRQEDRMDRIEAQIQELRADMRNEIREVRSRIWWLVGIMVGTWVTTIGMLVAILVKA